MSGGQLLSALLRRGLPSGARALSGTGSAAGAAAKLPLKLGRLNHIAIAVSDLPGVRHVRRSAPRPARCALALSGGPYMHVGSKPRCTGTCSAARSARRCRCRSTG